MKPNLMSRKQFWILPTPSNLHPFRVLELASKSMYYEVKMEKEVFYSGERMNYGFLAKFIRKVLIH